MMCYRDITFCKDADHCATQECRRRLTKEDRERAIKLGIPVAMASFAATCDKYVPKEKKDE